MRQITQWVSKSVSQISIQIPLELLLKLTSVGVILIITWIISRMLGSFLSKALGKFSQNVARQARRIARWLVWLIGILVGLDQLGLELTILLMIVTLGGIVFVIALKDILSNVASHEMITSYSPFKIGDWIQVGKCFGRVVDITWMDTVLMTPNNEMVYIPNSKMTQSLVINKTIPKGIRISVPLTVDRALDISKVEKALLEIGTELGEELVQDSKLEVRVTHIDSKFIKLALLLKINNPAKGPFIASQVRRKIISFLDENSSNVASAR